MIRCYTTILSAPVDRDSSPQAEATEGKLQPEQRASTELRLLATPNVDVAGLGRSSAPASKHDEEIEASCS